MKKLAVLIPCFNEASGIANVIEGFPRQRLYESGYDLEIVVIDNNSTDRTAEIAKQAGAEVIVEAKQGKGNAIRAGFYHLSDDTDLVVMLDGDNTYMAAEILRLVELLDADFCSVVTGSRVFGRIVEGSMPLLNQFGNWFFSQLVRIAYPNVAATDVLSGYFAWKRPAIERLRPHLHSSGFAIEMEMITKMARLGERICSVPITYNVRTGDSKLRPIRDGLRILWMFVCSLFWRPSPLSNPIIVDDQEL